MNYPRVPTENALQLTLDAQLAAGGTSLTLNEDVDGIVQAPGYLVIDRVDSSGNKTPTKREFMYFTGVSGTSLTGLTRGADNSTDQVHAVGAIVEFLPTVGHEEDKHTVFTDEHTEAGKHKFASQAQGDILYFNGTAWVRLGAGTSGYFLKTQGASANPAWAAVSTDALTTTAKARAYITTADQTVPQTTITKLTLNAEAYDPGNNFDSTTDYDFTAPVTGYYMISAACQVSGAADGQFINLYIYVNAASVAQDTRYPGAGSAFEGLTVSTIQYLEANNTVSLHLQHNTTTSLLARNGAGITWMAVHLLST